MRIVAEGVGLGVTLVVVMTVVLSAVSLLAGCGR
jgi:hypothetical protein